MTKGREKDWKRLFKRPEKKVQTPVSELTFAVIDSETTGFDLQKDRMLSLGGLKVQDGRIRVAEAYEVFIAQDHFDAQSVPIHGIMKKGPNKRIGEREALTQFNAFVKDTILVGHHIGFDLEMIGRALQRNGFPPLENPALDTGRLYSKTLLSSPLVPKKAHYSLDELAEKYDISCKDRHTALGDAYITAMAFLRILGQLKQSKELTLKTLIRLGS